MGLFVFRPETPSSLFFFVIGSGVQSLTFTYSAASSSFVSAKGVDSSSSKGDVLKFLLSFRMELSNIICCPEHAFISDSVYQTVRGNEL